MKNSIKKITLALLLATIIIPNAWGGTSNNTVHKPPSEYDNPDNPDNPDNIIIGTANEVIAKGLEAFKESLSRDTVSK